MTVSALVRFKSERPQISIIDNGNQEVEGNPDQDSISLTLEEYEKHFVPNLPEELFEGNHAHSK